MYKTWAIRTAAFWGSSAYSVHSCCLLLFFSNREENSFMDPDQLISCSMPWIRCKKQREGVCVQLFRVKSVVLTHVQMCSFSFPQHPTEPSDGHQPKAAERRERSKCCICFLSFLLGRAVAVLAGGKSQWALVSAERYCWPSWRWCQGGHWSSPVSLISSWGVSCGSVGKWFFSFYCVWIES